MTWQAKDLTPDEAALVYDLIKAGKQHDEIALVLTEKTGEQHDRRSVSQIIYRLHMHFSPIWLEHRDMETFYLATRKPWVSARCRKWLDSLESQKTLPVPA